MHAPRVVLVKAIVPGAAPVCVESSLVRVDEPTPAQAAAGRYPKRTMPWKGLTIRIENEAGSVRRGTKPDGTPWESRMAFPYGEIARTEGVDGDPVDVFIGPFAETADTVFVVHQRRVDDWKRFDEDKCMVGWLTEDEARAAFLQCYDDPRFLGPITAMPVAEFIEKARATRSAPKMIKAVRIGDNRTMDLFSTHLETHTRKDGVVQTYHVASKKKVRDPLEGVHTEFTLNDGSVHRILRLNSTESMGLPGWHTMESSAHSSYLADTEDDAIRSVIDNYAKKQASKVDDSPNLGNNKVSQGDNMNAHPVEVTQKNNTRTIPVHLLDRTKAVLEKINRKAKKLGVDGFTMKVGEVRVKKVPKLDHHELDKFIEVVDIEVIGPQIKVNGGWVLEGKVDFEDGMTIVSSRPGVELPKKYREATPACEHCNSDRQRNAVFVFKNSAGEYKQVGRQCLKDFIGYNPDAVLWAAREFDGIMDDIDDEMDGGDGGGFRQLSARSDDVMSATVMAAREYGFVSRKTANERGTSSTADNVSYLLFDKKGYQFFRENITDVDREKATKIIEWAKTEFGAKEEKSDYEYNVSELLERDTVRMQRIPLLVSIIGGYNRANEENIRNSGLVDAYVGTVGERRDFVGRFLSEYAFETDYGWMYIGKFATDEGVVTYKGSSPFWEKGIDSGTEVKFTGTVKDHSEYKGKKQTLVQRCVLTKDKPPKKVKGQSNKKDAALTAAIDHLKEDSNQKDIPAAEKKEDAALVAKLKAALDGADDHPAPIPRLSIRGLADVDRDQWINLHRQQHEARYKDLEKVKRDLEGARSKRNKAETTYNEAASEHGKSADAKKNGWPGGERVEEYAAWANKANDEYRKHRDAVDRLSNKHAALHSDIAKLGAAKEKLLPGSGDLQFDMTSQRRRTDDEEVNHAKEQAKIYKTATMVLAKSLPAPRVTSVRRIS